MATTLWHSDLWYESVVAVLTVLSFDQACIRWIRAPASRADFGDCLAGMAALPPSAPLQSQACSVSVRDAGDGVSAGMKPVLDAQSSPGAQSQAEHTLPVGRCMFMRCCTQQHWGCVVNMTPPGLSIAATSTNLHLAMDPRQTARPSQSIKRQDTPCVVLCYVL